MTLGRDEPPTISTDLFINGKLRIYQLKDAFKSGSDAVFLSAFPKIKKGKVLDAGCGTGVVSLCLAKQAPQAHIEGLDIQEELISLAEKSAHLNDLSEQCTFTCGNITQAPYEKQSFDHVLTNPPYFNDSSPSPNAKIALSKSHTISPEKWVQSCIDLVKPRGFFYCIYPTTTLETVIQSLTGFGDIHIFPLWPKKNTPSKRVLIKAQKGIAKPSKLLPGMVLHSEDGTYTSEANAVLREGKRIEV